MQDTYQLPFRSCIQEAKASCLMCSYNAVNGIPACADKDLLQKARTEWNFKGFKSTKTEFKFKTFKKI